MADWWWRRALVTGASAGIGAETVRRLTRAGVPTVVVARRAERLRELAAGASARDGDVEVLPADLLDPDDRARVEQRLADEASPVDLLVNNAGFGRFGPFADGDRDGEQRQIDLNVTTLTRLAHAALGAMVARGRGSVLNVSSVAGYQPYPYAAVYGATKAFVNSLSHALHEETRGTGVTVTALCPGFTRTEFQEVAGFEETSVPPPLWTSVGQVVRDGLAAAAAGKSLAVPGRQFKVAAALSSAAPARLTSRLMARQNAAAR